MSHLLEQSRREAGFADIGPPKAGLQYGVLTPLETLGQSIAGIAPSTTPGLLIPIVFGFAGDGTWLSYLLATVGILLTAKCINEFASRSACHGSLYTFVSQGFGRQAGILTGWALLFAYVCSGAACLTGFTIYALSLGVTVLKIHATSAAMMLLSTTLVGYVSYKNVKLSASLMLWLELISVALILLIVGLALGKHGMRVDAQQLQISTLNFQNIRMGLVMAIFGFVAFESSAALGSEAIDPLKSVPQAIMRSVLFSGLFFVAVSYAMVMSFRGSGLSLDHCTTPLLVMANLVGLPSLGHLIDAGIMISFFASALACLNAVTRILYKMSQDGFFHRLLANTHDQNRTPHFAVMISSSTTFALALALAACKVSLLDIMGYLGTLATFGFIYAYAATSLSAAKMLSNINQFRSAKIFEVAASLLVLAVALFGSLFPSPPFPYNILPLVFGGYMFSGWIANRNVTRATSSKVA